MSARDKDKSFASGNADHRSTILGHEESSASCADQPAGGSLPLMLLIDGIIVQVSKPTDSSY